jgi:hypothetical protein
MKQPISNTQTGRRDAATLAITPPRSSVRSIRSQKAPILQRTLRVQAVAPLTRRAS